MPNKCTVCGKVHPDDAKYLLDGCDKCGSKFFFYVREGALKKAEADMKKLSKSDIKEIEEDIRFIIPKEVEKGETVILDLEAIHVIKPGKYEIDVTNLFTQKPVVIKVGPGKYEIDLSTLISKWREKLAAYRKDAEAAEDEEPSEGEPDEEGEPPEDEEAKGASEDDEGEEEDREEEEKHLNGSDK